MPFNEPLVSADLWSVAPIFSSTGLHPIADARVLLFLAQAEMRTARDIWGAKADWAVLYLAAHLLHLDVLDNQSAIVGGGGATPAYAGPIVSEAVGPISRSFGSSGGTAFVQGGTAAFADETLATTPWGKKLIELRKTISGVGAY